MRAGGVAVRWRSSSSSRPTGSERPREADGVTQVVSLRGPRVPGSASCDWHAAAYAPTRAHGEFSEVPGQLSGFTWASPWGALESTCGSARVGARGLGRVAARRSWALPVSSVTLWRAHTSPPTALAHRWAPQTVPSSLPCRPRPFDIDRRFVAHGSGRTHSLDALQRCLKRDRL